MDYSSTRSFTMTLAHRAVGDIRRDGFRQLRNYVDMCSALANRPRHHAFFTYAQKALERTDSCYYSLIQRLLNQVEENRICTVGVNLGFSALIYGAGQMKKQSEMDGQLFSWINAARCGDTALEQLVPQQEAAGSFAWVLDSTQSDPRLAVPLAQANPHCVFGLLAAPEALTSDTMDALSACENLMVMPLLEKPGMTEAVRAAAAGLRCRKMLFAFTVMVDNATAGQAFEPEWLRALAQEALICVYARRQGVTAQVSHRLHRGIVNSRLETGTPVLLLDWDGDIQRINHNLSDLAVIGNRLPAGASFPLNLE